MKEREKLKIAALKLANQNQDLDDRQEPDTLEAPESDVPK